MSRYTATFSVQFPEDARGAFVAYCYPYVLTSVAGMLGVAIHPTYVAWHGMTWYDTATPSPT